jgi:hypothetical protein
MKNLIPVMLFAALGLFPQTAAAQGVGLQITGNGIAFATAGPDGSQFEFMAGGPVSPAQPGGMVLKAIGKDGSGFVFDSRGSVQSDRGVATPPPSPPKQTPKTKARLKPGPTTYAIAA